MAYTQENRLIAIETPLGKDVLLLQGFTGREMLSRLFSFHLDLLCEPEKKPVAFSQIIGQVVTISIHQSGDTPRYINGVVSRFAQSGADARFTHYQMEMVPWTWMLTRFADCCIFHHKTVQQIIEAVFKKRGFTDYEISLTGTYAAREYTVQYRETDFNFVSRLMEHNGIFYFFKHEKTKHTMMIADDRSAHQYCPDQETAGYNLAEGGLDAGDVIHAWNIEQELKTGSYSLTDYNFTTSGSNLQVSEVTIVSVGGNSSYELFDYPGEYSVRSDGTSVAKLRMQEEEANHLVANGSSNCRAFSAGYKFTLADHYDSSMNVAYVLTDIQHVASVGANYSLGTKGPGESYTNSFMCIPESVPFRPARVTPKPFVQGPQTAVVVGKATDQDSDDDQGAGGDGEEIWVDKWGRVLVQFPWDRKKDISCWVRSSQAWAGEGWGMINIPRVGQEVIISFLEGDPDRPIITGRVYNDVQVVPYALPDNGTRTTFRTSSSTGGGTAHYNELRFEDKAGSEQVFIRGEKDSDTRILNDTREWVGNDRSLIVTNDQKESVGGDQHSQVTGDVKETVGGDVHNQVTGNVNQKIGQTLSIQVGDNLYEKSGTNFAHEAGEVIHLKAGTTVVIEAGTELCLKVGGNYIDINPSGIAIFGTLVQINSGGSAGSGPGSSPTAPMPPKDPDQADDGSKGTKMN